MAPLLFFLLFWTISPAHADFTRADVLRGSVGPGRDWWDVQKYDLKITIDETQKRISGENRITFAVVVPGAHPFMQIDLQRPMQIDDIIDDDNKPVRFRREGNVYWLDFATKYFAVKEPGYSITIRFSGSPQEAKRAPWDGGFIWTKDSKNRPWISAAVQGMGASAWYPCKDDDSDEPDNGASIAITPPDSLVGVSNGRPTKLGPQYAWEVMNPINAYNIIPYIGNYTSWHEEYFGEKGLLDLDFWVLDYNLPLAKRQFNQVPLMLRAFEYWFGPYPFYEDGYKLVEAPHLGMEHQSAIAYGNEFRNGYKGKDWSGSGWGMNFDFIIVHESAHEWFGNSITQKDLADMWIHEAFAAYSEVLFMDYYFGTQAGNDYCIGTRKNISNDKPVIGHYGVHDMGSHDMYSKGANMLHTIRQLIHNDEKFRQILRGLNKDFYHQTVTTQLVENYISEKSGLHLKPIFDQYLRSIEIPQLEYSLNNSQLQFRWTKVVDGFEMPIKLKNGTWITPTTAWQSMQWDPKVAELEVDRNFYVTTTKKRTTEKTTSRNR